MCVQVLQMYLPFCGIAISNAQLFAASRKEYDRSRVRTHDIHDAYYINPPSHCWQDRALHVCVCVIDVMSCGCLLCSMCASVYWSSSSYTHRSYTEGLWMIRRCVCDWGFINPRCGVFTCYSVFNTYFTYRSQRTQNKTKRRKDRERYRQRKWFHVSALCCVLAVVQRLKQYKLWSTFLKYYFIWIKLLSQLVLVPFFYFFFTSFCRCRFVVLCTWQPTPIHITVNWIVFNTLVIVVLLFMINVINALFWKHFCQRHSYVKRKFIVNIY